MNTVNVPADAPIVRLCTILTRVAGVSHPKLHKEAFPSGTWVRSTWHSRMDGRLPMSVAERTAVEAAAARILNVPESAVRAFLDKRVDWLPHPTHHDFELATEALNFEDERHAERWSLLLAKHEFKQDKLVFRRPLRPFDFNRLNLQDDYIKYKAKAAPNARVRLRRGTVKHMAARQEMIENGTPTRVRNVVITDTSSLRQEIDGLQDLGIQNHVLATLLLSYFNGPKSAPRQQFILLDDTAPDVRDALIKFEAYEAVALFGDRLLSKRPRGSTRRAVFLRDDGGSPADRFAASAIARARRDLEQLTTLRAVVDPVAYCQTIGVSLDVRRPLVQPKPRKIGSNSEHIREIAERLTPMHPKARDELARFLQRLDHA